MDTSTVHWGRTHADHWCRVRCGKRGGGGCQGGAQPANYICPFTWKGLDGQERACANTKDHIGPHQDRDGDWHPITKHVCESKQCRFTWTRKYIASGRLVQYQCLRHHGHDNEHIGRDNATPSKSELDEAREEGALDA